MSPRDSELQRWAGDENPEFIVLVDTAIVASESPLIGPDAIRASADSFGLSDQHGRNGWSRIHALIHYSLTLFKVS